MLRFIVLSGGRPRVRELGKLMQTIANRNGAVGGSRTSTGGAIADRLHGTATAVVTLMWRHDESA